MRRQKRERFLVGALERVELPLSEILRAVEERVGGHERAFGVAVTMLQSLRDS